MGLFKTSGLIKKVADRSHQNILNNNEKHRREGFFQTKEQKQTPCACVYCDKQGHKTSQYESVKSVEDRRLILSKRNSILTALRRNIETLIAVATNDALFAEDARYVTKNENVLLKTNSNACTYPSVIVNIEEIKCRALVDTRAGASYVSSTIISLINQKVNKKSITTESTGIETLVSSFMINIPVYSVEIKDINNEFSFKT